MMQFLEDQQGKGKPPITPEERIELEMLRGEFANLKSKLEGKGMSAEEVKDAALQKKSLTDPNAASKLKKNKKQDYSSSDSEVSTLIKNQPEPRGDMLTIF